ncbi:hypothetical protein O997_05985 [Anaplasma phagocytophilum str. MRK]|nr:hypothetical protein O997_05985 [Anaplasma phagocytophilum str. MRK]
MSYQLSPEISAFAGGFYHRVVGDGVYDDLPAQRLVDDTSPAGRTKDTAVANFSMAYVGGEFGVRWFEGWDVSSISVRTQNKLLTLLLYSTPGITAF